MGGSAVFFFQAEDGIRDIGVTGVQTCALPIFFVVGCVTKLACLLSTNKFSSSYTTFKGISIGRIPVSFSFSDRKSTRLNSSHANISYAVFCLKKKKQTILNLFILLYTLPNHTV